MDVTYEVVINFPTIQVTETTPGVASYTCDCPDFTKQVGANPVSPYGSEKFARSWSDSGAGADGDCWHIHAARYYNNEGKPFANDAPIEQSKLPQSRTQDPLQSWAAESSWNQW